MPRKPSWKATAGVVLALVFVLGIAWWRFNPRREEPVYLAVIPLDLRRVSGTPPDEARNCVACHAQEVADWKDSHHANANRLFNPQTDSAAFQHGGTFSANGSKTILQTDNGNTTIAVVEPGGTRTVYRPEAVIGVTPLAQYLLPFPGGRLQALNLAFDPRNSEWFDMQAPETATPDDWSNWQNRGMNWNSQCAFCHMTNLQKGYDAKSDTYRTTWDAMGISCAQCHGSMEQHAANPKDPALFNRLTVQQMMENCGSCHARREELNATFHAGEKFSDHYRLSLPDEAGLYYPDGQVKEEDYEFGSFMMSKMGNKGVTCLDCHNPHSGALRLPVENNALCLSCHAPPAQRGAIPIDVATHSHHMAGTPGDRCVDCHMPVTTYMGRDARRDHGFTIPDPVLTKELGVPNSCNRCHADESADWAIETTDKWYGDKMERPTRERALVIGRAEKNDGAVLPELLTLAKTEDIPAWRSVMVSLLGQWSQQADVRAALEKSLSDASPLVRSAAVRDLSQVPDSAALIKPLCDDPSRLVRLDAAWGLHDARDRTHPSYRELVEYLNQISDQPAGALRQTQFAMDEHRIDDALNWSAKAAAWDATSGEAHQAHAVALHSAGKTDEAIAELRKAGEVDPENAQHPFMLALLCGEAGQTDEVIVELKKAVAIDPAFGRAWYNLGLALAQQNQLPDSIAALARAEDLLPGTPEVPYALATVYARANQMDQARNAAMRAQAFGYPPASDLLKQLSQ
jgi:predicted CXXCH cytochrome family protein